MARRTIAPKKKIEIKLKQYDLLYCYQNCRITSENATEGRMNATCVIDRSSRERSRNRIRGHKGAHYVTDSQGDHFLASINFGSSCCAKL